MVVAEEPLVHGLIASPQPGAALDAACGTGRHAAWLVSRGHRVIGVDSSTEMLEVARATVPGAGFHEGDLSALPVDAHSIDLAVCALALTHLVDPAPAIHELARVLRPGGQLIISDVHPLMGEIGMHCNFPIAPGHMGFVRNYAHWTSTYLVAFKDAGLDVNQCLEPRWGERELATQVWAAQQQAAIHQALAGLPILLVWDVVKRS